MLVEVTGVIFEMGIGVRRLWQESVTADHSVGQCFRAGGREALMVAVKYPSLFYEGPSDQSRWWRLEECKKKPFKWLFFSKQDINIGK